MKPTRRGVSKKGKTISRCYGWAPDLPDQRAYRYSALPSRVLR
ncbi:MAG TPA: hypothetical protein VLD55_12550 [Candidatus Sulfobium mesophilum]|nr:hypothetical protein [Candidatus Sulfobium mesophilum]